MIPRNAVGEIIPVLLATRIAVPDSEKQQIFYIKKQRQKFTVKNNFDGKLF